MLDDATVGPESDDDHVRERLLAVSIGALLPRLAGGGVRGGSS
jgi:hypothetical protein